MARAAGLHRCQEDTVAGLLSCLAPAGAAAVLADPPGFDRPLQTAQLLARFCGGYREPARAMAPERMGLRPPPAPVLDQIGAVLADLVAPHLAALDLEARAAWRATCKAFTRVSEGAAIDYAGASGLGPVLYALGSSPAQAAMAWVALPLAAPELFEAAAAGRTDRVRVLALCGGSGAELIGLVLRLDSMAGPLLTVQVRVMDHCGAWAAGLEALQRCLAAVCTRVRLEVEFEQIDLLLPSATELLTTALAGCQLCTLCYGFSELHERDPNATGRFVSAMLAECSRQGARCVVIDPLSIQHDKPSWLDQQAAAHHMAPAVAIQAKIQLPPSQLAGSPLQRCFEQLGLRIGHDVKTFCNFWLRAYTCDQQTSTCGNLAPRGDSGQQLRVLAVVPEAAVQSFGALCVAAAGSSAVQLRGDPKAPKSWEQMWRVVAGWRATGGILVAEQVQLPDLLLGCTSERALQACESLSSPDLMAVLIHPSKPSKRLLEALATIRPLRQLLVLGGDSPGIEQLPVPLRRSSVWFARAECELQAALSQNHVTVSHHHIQCNHTERQTTLVASCKQACQRISCALHPGLLSLSKKAASVASSPSWSWADSERTAAVRRLLELHKRVVVFWLLPQSVTAIEHCLDPSMAELHKVDRFRDTQRRRADTGQRTSLAHFQAWSRRDLENCTHTKDGAPICYKFNYMDCDGACDRAHRCDSVQCGDKAAHHPRRSCPSLTVSDASSERPQLWLFALHACEREVWLPQGVYSAVFFDLDLVAQTPEMKGLYREALARLVNLRAEPHVTLNVYRLAS